MSHMEKLRQLSDEAVSLGAELEPLTAEWDAANQIGSDSDDPDTVEAAAARMEAVGPRIQEILSRIEDINTESDELAEAAREELEETIEALQSIISDVYTDVPASDADWMDDIEGFREWAADARSAANAGTSETRSAPALRLIW